MGLEAVRSVLARVGGVDHHASTDRRVTGIGDTIIDSGTIRRTGGRARANTTGADIIVGAKIAVVTKSAIISVRVFTVTGGGVAGINSARVIVVTVLFLRNTVAVQAGIVHGAEIRITTGSTGEESVRTFTR